MRRGVGWRSLTCLLLLPTPAAAQLAASLSATSDFRNRGLSLNGGGAALTASVAYDHPSGAYVGVSASGGDTRRFGARFLSHSAVAGYAARLNRDLSWDAGVANTQIYSNVYGRFSGRYTEVFAGLSSETLSARVYFAPDYIVPDLSTVYFDVNGTVRAARRLRLFAHGGLLVPVGGRSPAVLPRARYDLRLGIAAELRGCDVQLAWVRTGARDDFLAPRRQSRDALVVGASWFF